MYLSAIVVGDTKSTNWYNSSVHINLKTWSYDGKERREETRTAGTAEKPAH